MKFHYLNLLIGFFILGCVLVDVLLEIVTFDTLIGLIIGTLNVYLYCFVELQE